MHFEVQDAIPAKVYITPMDPAVFVASSLPLEDLVPTKRRTPKRFRLQAKKYALTFPKCEVSKETAMQNVLAMDQPPLIVVISREKHEDGTNHLHLFLEFEHKHTWTKPDCFDFIAAQHGNYQTCRNRRQWVTYIVKDADYLLHGIDEAGLGSLLHKKPFDISLVALVRDLDIRKYAEAFPGYFVRHHAGVQKLVSVIRSKRRRDAIVPYAGFPIQVGGTLISYTYDNPQFRLIHEWLMDRMDPRRSAIKRRAKQLYIHGRTMTGKTTLVDRLAQHFHMYMVPQEHFYDRYTDEDYDLAVFEEFTGHKKVSFMNMWLEGQNLSLRVKGSQYEKYLNIPSIILSNSPPEVVYSVCASMNPLLFEAFLARLTVIELAAPIFDDLDLYWPVLTESSPSIRTSVEQVESSINPGVQTPSPPVSPELELSQGLSLSPALHNS